MRAPGDDDLATAFARLSSLHAALAFGRAQAPPWNVVDVIVQDEYTHDVVFARDGGGAVLVLDCT